MHLPRQAEFAGSEALEGGHDELTGDEYIVQFVDGVDADAETQRLQSNGVDVVATFDDSFLGASVTASSAEASAMRADPRVASVSRDVQFRAQTDDDTSSTSEFGTTATQTDAPWGLDRVDQRNLPLSDTFTSTGTGAGVTVYVLDSGIRGDHVEFGGRVGPGAYITSLGPEDCDGHGTHVAGTAGGSTYGVAKAVTLVPVKVLDCNGVTNATNVAIGLDWIIEDHEAGEPAVLNASIGGPANSFVDGKFQEAINDGITVVIAAGNEYDVACSYSPGRLPAAITVAATNINDFSPNFSNYGTCVDVFAPGVDITSAWITSSTATATINGTSMAAPHVAGAAALILQRTPTLTPAQVAAQIVQDATIGAVDNEGTGSPNRLLYVPDVAVPTFVPVVPARLLETRPGLSTVDNQFLGQGVVPAGGIVELAVGGRAGVAANATAAVLNVTVIEPATAGFVTVFPCGSGVPNSSSVNFVAHATVANAVVSKLGINGRVCLYSNSATHLVVDVNGYFPAGSSFVSVVPARVLETRPGLPTVDGLFAGQGTVPSGDIVELTVAGRGGVGSDALAVVLNVTVVGPAASRLRERVPVRHGVSEQLERQLRRRRNGRQRSGVQGRSRRTGVRVHQRRSPPDRRCQRLLPRWLELHVGAARSIAGDSSRVWRPPMGSSPARAWCRRAVSSN